MTHPTKITADEFVEYAKFLFGAQWRDELSAALGLPRKTVVMMLASGDEIPQSLALSMLNLLEEKLAEMAREQANLKQRIRFLRGNPRSSVVAATRSWGDLQHAC